MNKLSIFMSFFIISLFSFQVFAQEEKSKGIINENGWKIPSVEQLEIAQNAGRWLHYNVKVNELNVEMDFFALSYKVEQPNQVQFEDFFTEEEISRVNNSYFLEMRSLASISFREKVFAYRIGFTPFTISEYGVKEYKNRFFIYYFIDKDDDGKFETRAKDLEKVPDWIVK